MIQKRDPASEPQGRMMRRWLLIMALVGWACGGSGRIVVVYSPHGVEMLSAFERRFEAAYPEIDVQWIDMGSQDALDRVRSERANPQGDVWWGGPSTMFDQAARAGLLEAHRPSWAAQVDSTFRGPDDLWYGTFQTPEVIAFNSEVLTAETAPADWDDLLDPQWEGKIVIRYPLQSGTMRTIFGAMMLREMEASGNEKDGYAWLARLDANTKEYAANPTLMNQKLARREGIVTLWNLTDILLQRTTYGYPFDFVLPESGTPVLTEGIALVRGAKHPDDAILFYEFVTSAESQSLQAREFFRIPTRRDLEMTSLPDWLQRLAIVPMPLDWALMTQRGPAWMKHWDQRIKGRGADYLAALERSG